MSAVNHVSERARRRDPSGRERRQKMAELIRPFVSPLGAWNAQVPQLKAMLASSHVSPSQKAQAAADAEKLLAEVRSAQSAFLMATSEVAGHDRVHDVRLSMSHIEQQLSQVLASLSS